MALASSASVAPPEVSVRFFKKHLTDEFWAEGAHLTDFNHDGKLDFVYGPYLFEGESFEKRTKFRYADQIFKVKLADGTDTAIPGFEGARGTNNAYSDDFLTFTHDFNDEGWPDIMVYGFP